MSGKDVYYQYDTVLITVLKQPESNQTLPSLNNEKNLRTRINSAFEGYQGSI